jgi:hypothetical protein
MFDVRMTREWDQWIAALSAQLHGRNRWRLQTVLLGILFASGRRTISSWWRAAGVGCLFRSYYYFIDAVGRKAMSVASALFQIVMNHIQDDSRPFELFAIDDTPTNRFGPKVQGAGYHHNPTPGPAGSKFLYGHNWVVLARQVRHNTFGLISLPLIGLLYVREKEIPLLPTKLGVVFRTKLDLAAELIRWLGSRWALCSKPIWVVLDGFYAKKEVFQAARESMVVLVTRIRWDSKVFELPPKLKSSQKRGRGRPPKYGKRINMANKAVNAQGWTRIEVLTTDGRKEAKDYKSFQATLPGISGPVRIVLLREEDMSWRALMCSDPAVRVDWIIQASTDRWAIEQSFHDLKETERIEEVQVRRYHANVGALNLNLWAHTLTELWAWHKKPTELVHRQASPWDDPNRRPSHADRRKSLKIQIMQYEYNRLDISTSVRKRIQPFMDLLQLRAA